MVRYGQKYARERHNMAIGVPLVATWGTWPLKVLLILSHAKTEVGGGRVLVSTAQVSEERILDFVIFENGFGWERAQWNRILLSGGSNFEPNDAYKSLYQLYKEGIPKKNMLFTGFDRTVWEKMCPWSWYAFDELLHVIILCLWGRLLVFSAFNEHCRWVKDKSCKT